MDALLRGDGSCLGCLAQYGAGSDGFRAVVPRVVVGAKFGCQCRRGNGDCLLVCAHVRYAHRARRSVEDEKAVLEYRANGSTETARVRQLALLTSRSLSDVQSQILLMTAEGATTKAIAEDVGYAASTVQALRSASYRQLKIKNKAELILLLSQVNNV